MKRFAYLVLGLTILLSACSSLPSLGAPQDAPAVDVQATDQALAATLAVETLNALPTPTSEPATNTPESTATEITTTTVTPTETATSDPNATHTETLTPDPNATATETGTPGTATASATVTFTPSATPTGTLPTATVSITPSPTETLYARFYGTLYPSLPSGRIRLTNKSKVEVYVSLHCNTIDGYTTILEYPVIGKMRVDAPAGSYSYVAWVGGRSFNGWFKLGKGNLVEIVFEKNKVSVKK